MQKQVMRAGNFMRQWSNWSIRTLRKYLNRWRSSMRLPRLIKLNFLILKKLWSLLWHHLTKRRTRQKYSNILNWLAKCFIMRNCLNRHSSSINYPKTQGKLWDARRRCKSAILKKQDNIYNFSFKSVFSMRRNAHASTSTPNSATTRENS